VYDAVYDEAQQRVRSLSSSNEPAQSLAAVLWRLNEERREEKRSRRKR